MVKIFTTLILIAGLISALNSLAADSLKKSAVFGDIIVTVLVLIPI
nr:hypothetical protein [Desulfobulbaceae bacterium]